MIAKWWKYQFMIWSSDWQQYCNSEKLSLMETQFYLNPYLNTNGLLIWTNSMINWEDCSEHSSYYFEQNCGSYKSVVWKIKSIFHSIIWIALSPLSHTYIDLDLLISEVSWLLLVVTFSMCFFLSWYSRWYFFSWRNCLYYYWDFSLE